MMEKGKDFDIIAGSILSSSSSYSYSSSSKRNGKVMNEMAKEKSRQIIFIA
jgi:hypothetical protein